MNNTKDLEITPHHLGSFPVFEFTLARMDLFIFALKTKPTFTQVNMIPARKCHRELFVHYHKLMWWLERISEKSFALGLFTTYFTEWSTTLYGITL